MNKSLLPTGSSDLEVSASLVNAVALDIKVPFRTLVNPDNCQPEWLPYLAWSCMVDRWHAHWPTTTKRDAIKSARFVHQHKGTKGAIHRVVEPLGYVIQLTEWWELNETPGTFRLKIAVLDHGISEEIQIEIERLIQDAKPASRHLIGLTLVQESVGNAWISAAAYSGDITTIYPSGEEET